MTSLIAFLGPSLPVVDAKRLLRDLGLGAVTLLPPAARGDVWRSLRLRPRAIALIDGVFEAHPSVWHREILEALELGIAVFGGASMGALRAVELGAFGMVGVGHIHRWYRDGTVQDDAEVALLHTDAAHGYRPLTVPLVNVRWIAQCAREERVLRAGEARSLVSAATSIFYQDRLWPAMLARLGRSWPARTRTHFERWRSKGLPDLKADDARACLKAAALLARAPGKNRSLPAVPRLRPPSSLVQWRLGGLPPRDPQIDALAAFARGLSLTVQAAEMTAARADWANAHGIAPGRLQAWLDAAGVNPAAALRWAEDLALAKRVGDQRPRLLP